MTKNILMVAAENDALPNAKVGGIGDVIRDIPGALAAKGCTVHVLLPSHGFLHELPGAKKSARFPVVFGGALEDVTLYELPANATKSGKTVANVRQWVVHHRHFSPHGKPAIYCNDGAERPFATDASKFAFFSAAAGQAILEGAFGELDVLHLHDWHTAMLAVLRAFDGHYKALLEISTVYTIHNLSLQGVRPLAGDESSLQRWFPMLNYDLSVVCDPLAKHCINPMRAAITLSDKVHAVSPNYATEIQNPSVPEQLVFGGEGLEADLKTAAKQGRLFGVLNGCDYSSRMPVKLSKARLADLAHNALLHWAAKEPVLASAHWIAQQRLTEWLSKKERGFVMTFVGRLTDQKVSLLTLPAGSGRKEQTVLDVLLGELKTGVLIMLGSGNPDMESFLLEVSGRHKNFIYLQGYSDALAQALYASGDLFLMPSSFEPCGISQMLAMRAGQPCLVHGVGGLKDTVKHGQTGFVFDGLGPKNQAKNLLQTAKEALAMYAEDSKTYKQIGKAATKERFTWDSAAEDYIRYLYSNQPAA